MKYGKKYQETLQAPGIPEEWRQQAIEYRQLKKVINRVATELKDLGLTSDVLKDLLSQKSTSPTSTSASTNSSPLPNGKGRPRRRSSTVRASTSGHLSTSPTFAPSEDDKLEAAVRIESVADEEAVTWDSSEDSSHHAPISNGQMRKDKRRRQSKLRRARASYELAGDSSNPEPRIHIVFSSASSASISESSSGESSSSAHVRGQIGRHSSNRFTELHDSSEDDSSPARSADGGDLLPHQHHEHHHHRSKHHPHHVKAPTEGDDESANEEGTTTSSSSAHRAKIRFEGAGPQANALLKKMYGLEESDTEITEPDPEGQGEDEDEDHAKAMQELAEVELDFEPKRRRSDETLRTTVPVDQEHVEAMKKLSIDTEKSARRTSLVEQANERQATDADADDEGPERPRRRRRRHIHHQPRKEVFIPLNKDNEFLGLLAKALASLAALQLAQKQNFTTAVELLAREVSAVSSPNRPKSDLYIWRDIFSLWVEAQIFESARERDRGERSVEAVQEKLSWFVDQVAKRKLAKRMKHKESRHALERFIQLNVELLDMKKFQLANEEAARKILKKHDKRTALTASLGFPKFIAAASSLSASSSPDNPNSRVLTLPGFPSLPHVLLSTFTATLLPIIPQLDDYECAICGEVAFKPIRLECGHKFCVRCLVKMQKRGQDACPQCRSPVVLRANATNLDTAMQSYLQLWFPKEVKAKAKSNAKEAAMEELAEMGMDDNQCAVM